MLIIEDQDNKSVPGCNNLAANQWADFWFYDCVGVNVIPRVGKKAIIKYSPYRNNRIPEELFNDWKNSGKFNENMCCMVGKLSGHTETLQYARKGLYLNFADFDNELAIREFCNYKDRQFTLEEISKVVYVVQHIDDASHCHAYWISSKPMAKRTIDNDKKIKDQIRNNQLPAIEIKAAGDVAFCPGGYHESGNPYEPIGTNELFIIEELGEHIESICRKYQLPVSDSERNKLRRLALAKALKEKNFLSTSTRTLYDYDLNEDWTDILENSRNNTLFDRARKYYRRNKDLILSDDTFRKIVHSWNKKYCKPPLPQFEVNGICNSILNHNNGGQD